MWALYFDNHKEASRLWAKFPSWCRSYLHILYQSTVFQSCGIPKHLLPTWLLSMSVHLWCVCTYLCPTNSVIVSSSLIKVPVLPYTQSKRSAGHRITHYAIRLHDIKNCVLHEMHVFFITHFLTSTVCRWWFYNCRMQPVEALKGTYLTFCMCATVLRPFDAIMFVWHILCV